MSQIKSKFLYLTVQEIQVEHDVLKTGMEAFSTWTRQRLQSVEEDIDVCRVVYSLHGSMSQVRARVSVTIYNINTS